ncbi:MAG: stage III sporulation protein AE [Caldicoprobacterales bacterium]|jgi:stage III sporulation protein AE
MKKSMLIGMILVTLLFPMRLIHAQPESNGDPGDEIRRIAEDQLDNLNIDQWNEYIKGIGNYQENIFINMDAKEMIVKILNGDFEFDWKEIFQSIGKILFREISYSLSLVIKILAIAIITGALGNFKTSFSNSSVGELAWIISYIMIIILVIQSVTIALDTGKNAIDQMTSFMSLIFPVLLALLIGMGGIASSSILQPATVILSNVTGIFLRNVMIPLIFLSTILILVSNINENISLGGLSKLIKNACGWTLGIIFTIFVGVISIQGILAASFDGVSIRTTKYAIEAFVPVVGKMFSQTVDMVIGCSLILKNAVGVVGLIIAAAICLYPALKIISLIAIYKLCGALLEPISDKRVVTCMNEIAGVLSMLFITVAGIAIMFFMTIALLVGVGNITIMMR